VATVCQVVTADVLQKKKNENAEVFHGKENSQNSLQVYYEHDSWKFEHPNSF
jgi:hypothetical protein